MRYKAEVFIEEPVANPSGFQRMSSGRGGNRLDTLQSVGRLGTVVQKLRRFLAHSLICGRGLAYNHPNDKPDHFKLGSPLKVLTRAWENHWGKSMLLSRTSWKGSSTTLLRYIFYAEQRQLETNSGKKYQTKLPEYWRKDNYEAFASKPC